MINKQKEEIIVSKLKYTDYYDNLNKDVDDDSPCESCGRTDGGYPVFNDYP
ncbi:MAG: hypothetical protein LBH40_05605 [Alphaproteobacteria bacterium]|jgi:hypothetical protein|nr:hypothetical protein [Alphaproteobacteria bacterium]